MKLVPKQDCSRIWPPCLALVLSLQSVSAHPRTNALPKAADLDPASFTEFVDGQERPVELKGGPAGLLWTKDRNIEWTGLKFGDSKQSGPRHLRIGLKSAVEAGAILTRGQGALSILKPGAPYPGNLADDSQWLPAKRTGQNLGEPTQDDYTCWTLPTREAVRALRLTHSALPADADYSGWSGGLCLLPEPVVNVATLAEALTTANPRDAPKIIDGTNNKQWQIWDNGREGSAQRISPTNPEYISLVWPQPLKLSGVVILWSGCGDVEVQSFTGPASRHPRHAQESDWHPVGSASGWESGYPIHFWPNAIHFSQPVTTRALRLRMTGVVPEGHPHLKGNTKDGRRLWLGELLALAPAADASPAWTETPQPSHPPIRFDVQSPIAGFATVVIEDTAGRRVRNLAAEAPVTAGTNTFWWDGTDDLERDPDAPRHGLYYIPPRLVAPGDYHIRGLVRPTVDLTYEMSVYNSGQPPWETNDKTGCWMTNHTPPTAVTFVPAWKTRAKQSLLFMGSFVAEGGHGLQWVTTDGRKIGGQGWIGGNWTGAPTLATDLGAQADPSVLCYAASIWEGELRITAKTTDFADRPILKLKLGNDQFPPGQRRHPDIPTLEGFDGGDRRFVLGGLAAHDGRLVVTLTRQSELLFIDAKRNILADRQSLPDFPTPRGAAFTTDGTLWMLSANSLAELQFTSDGHFNPIHHRGDFDDPRHLAIAGDGHFYISQRGGSHQVVVLDAKLKPVRKVGHPGVPQAGPYNREKMHQPNGLALDDAGQLWVMENDYQPKRVSVWQAESGKFLRAYYGPAEYGGGGQIDPEDTSRFYFHGMAFHLDWKSGAHELQSVFYRPQKGDLGLPDGPACDGYPQTAIYLQGRRYFTNCFNSNPTNGAAVTMLWLERAGRAEPIAALGRAKDWTLLLQPEFLSRWPAGHQPTGDYHKSPAWFLWWDANADSHLQPQEVTISPGYSGGITMLPDLSFAASRLGQENDMQAMRWKPQKVSAQGVPEYDPNHPQILFPGAQPPQSSGGDQILTNDASGWTISTVAMRPFAPTALGGAKNGQPLWQYPSLWPGLHASHEAPPPSLSGQIIGTTRLLGSLFTPLRGDAGPCFALNGNMGNIYLFTADGLFLAELFKDVRQGPLWAMPTATRGMKLNGLTLHDENFWPSITQGPSGELFLVDGGRTSLVKVSGLDQVRRWTAKTLTLSPAELEKCRRWMSERESARQQRSGTPQIIIQLRHEPPKIDGQLDDWAEADWAVIDQRGVAANFNSDSKPYDAAAALTIARDRLCAAFRTGDKELLRNSGETPNAPFKTGGALDLMLGPVGNRTQPTDGDLRLLVTKIHDRPQALLYRAIDPTSSQPEKFSSPWRTITIGSVTNVTSALEFGQDGHGNYEISIPLDKLGLTASPGEWRGDLGILRGNGSQTVQRVYWANKATAIVSDVPSEAELTPAHWGIWLIK